jgi:hypothetical protein
MLLSLLLLPPLLLLLLLLIITLQGMGFPMIAVTGATPPFQLCDQAHNQHLLLHLAA